MSHIIFDDPSHTYTNRDTGEVYTSATQVIGLYKQPFDGPYWSLYKATERLLCNVEETNLWRRILFDIRAIPKDAEQLLDLLMRVIPKYVPWVLQVQDKILEEWEDKKDKACAKGTAYHLFREQQAYNEGHQKLTGTSIAGNTSLAYSFDLATLQDGYHAELLVYNHALKLAGQVDRCWITTEGNTRYIDIDDYKTNAKIKLTNKYQRMKAPINHLEDCNYHHYRMQIGLYSWMLEQAGYTPRSCRFTHIETVTDPVSGEELINRQTGEISGIERAYTFDYPREDVRKLLNHYQANK